MTFGTSVTIDAAMIMCGLHFTPLGSGKVIPWRLHLQCPPVQFPGTHFIRIVLAPETVARIFLCLMRTSIETHTGRNLGTMLLMIGATVGVLPVFMHGMVVP